jgi:tetratricopeptide (TPR) repeat protein
LLRDILDTDPIDAHSYLALARLEAKRQADPCITREAFSNGTIACPDSVHLWQAWAVHEDTIGNTDKARELFETALLLDSTNPYVCHAFGLLNRKQGNDTRAMQLWNEGLLKTSTAALVCSLGELLIAKKLLGEARELYTAHVGKLDSEREKIEVYLAASWLEERYFKNFDKAEELIKSSLICSPTSSLAQVALARLEGRRRQRHEGAEIGKATVRRLASACMVDNDKAMHSDGRVYNAWANIEVKSRRFAAARKILRQGLEKFPSDHALLQATGKVEERMGNFTAARDLYSASLRIQPSAPTLVSYALLEHRNPIEGVTNLTMTIRLFEEALLVDPRHGPAYNAYARTLVGKNDVDAARKVLERGIRANCPDTASIYHGYARLELSLGNVDKARKLLIQGQREAHRNDIGRDSPHRERAAFLTHTLGMLELNRNRPSDALQVFSEGIERYGNSSQLLLGSALCEVKLGNEMKARKLFEKAVLNDAKHAQAWQAWGVMEIRAGNVKTAKTLFECGIKSAPRHGALWQAYATMESRLGNIDNARALFETGIKRAPKHIPLYQSWAATELKEDNFTASKALIAEALTRDKRNGDAWLIAAEIEERSGNSGLGTLLLRRGIECSPSSARLYGALGDALVRKGKINEARDVFENGIAIDPMHAPLYHKLAELEASVFNLEGLSKLNKRATQLFNSNALEPTQSSSEAFGTKIKAHRSWLVPTGVAALADKIVEEDNPAIPEEVNGNTFLDRMHSNLMEDGPVGQLLSLDED